MCSGWLNDARRRGKHISRYFASQYFWMQNVAMNLSKIKDVNGYVKVVLCISRPSQSQSNRYLGSVVPLAMF